jgi:thioredoxin reductase (NADPH)
MNPKTSCAPMKNRRHNRLIILGSGPAGYSAAVYAARANRAPLLITGVEEGGQLMTTTDVDNWPGDVEGLQGPALMERMRRHAERFATEIVNDHIDSVRICPSGPSNCTATARSTAAMPSSSQPARRHVPRDSFRGEIPRQGRLRLRNLRRVFLSRAARRIVGGGNTAVEEALYLSHIAAHVTLVHRRERLRAEKILQKRLFDEVEAGKDRSGVEPHRR